MAVLQEAFFANVWGGSYASQYCGRFKSSLPDSHLSELECAMLALVATAFMIKRVNYELFKYCYNNSFFCGFSMFFQGRIHSALDDYSTGVCKKTEFNADLYEDIYIGHNSFLLHIRDGSITKYHRMMSDLYNQASAVSVMPSMSVTNDAIAQLDLDGMAE
ncbi:hypothetical protein EDB84DRAFT_1442387 [Lactarius hengduanensis]|nr:hypothetical protein EDB84DRAFT_1442387 [Lactarius hengduanensis]